MAMVLMELVVDDAQVKFVHEAFRRLRPGIPLSCLHGRMKQMARMATFYKYNETKHALLFATDVAARGLDFPDVDWVLQVLKPKTLNRVMIFELPLMRVF